MGVALDQLLGAATADEVRREPRDLVRVERDGDDARVGLEAQGEAVEREVEARGVDTREVLERACRPRAVAEALAQVERARRLSRTHDVTYLNGTVAGRLLPGLLGRTRTCSPARVMRQVTFSVGGGAPLRPPPTTGERRGDRRRTRAAQRAPRGRAICCSHFVVRNSLIQGTHSGGWAFNKSTLVGNYITSLDMAGCSVTLLRADDEVVRLWDAPVNTPGLRWGV